ncbi:MAG: exopolysaccharide biosynthesis polyprenyl glycosylphosphotransferase [Lachnospiraceae bacterium]|nr:exopolysaccharide biosynthesis polyprenyl glycosylphosphotransferase [Lachnospiraceae bacterium]
MRELGKRFEKSILLLFALIMYALNLVAFFGLFSVDNPEITDLSRTAAVTLSTYVIFLFLLTCIYGRYDAGRRKEKQTVFSLMSAAVLTDLMTYFELTIMKTNEANNDRFTIENVGILLLSMLLQLLIILCFTRLGSSFYFWVNGKEKCLIVTENTDQGRRVRAALGDFAKRYEVIGMVSFQEEILQEQMLKADTIVLYDVPVEVRERIVGFCYQNLKNVYFNPTIADIIEQHSKTTVVDDISFFTSEFHLISFEERIIKRVFDVLLSILALLLLSPVLLVSAICIRRYDGGPVFFRQKRATANGRVFEIYKFRTMKENSDDHSVTTDDDRITGPGRFLRKYRIDELPQLFNIVKGDMSLVGPRPEMLKNVEDYTKELPEFVYRLRMKAGLTGYAQIYGKYNTGSRDKLMLDLMYIENYSILKDIQILFQTVSVLFKAEDSTEAFQKHGK